jgi:hypothetical protein
MTHLTGTVRRVALSAAVLGGAMGSLGLLASSATAAPSLAATTKTTTVNYSISCNLGILGTNTLTGQLTSTYPGSVVTGKTAKGTGSGYIQVPVSLVNAGYALGARSFAGSIGTLNIDSSDATPAVFNAAGSGINIPMTPVVKGQPIKLLIPASGTIPVGPWTAGAVGTDKATLSNSAATVNLYNKSGVEITSIAAACNAPATTTVVAKIKVKS